MNLRLKLHGSKRLATGHPWVRGKDQLSWRPPAPAGTVLRAQDAKGDFLAHVISNGPATEPMFVALSRERHAILDPGWVAARVELALGGRRRLKVWPQRLVHGEADGLPGIYVDAWNDDSLTIEVVHPGMAILAGHVATALREQIRPKAMWMRLAMSEGPGLWVDLKGAGWTLECQEDGLRYRVPLDGTTMDFPIAERAWRAWLRAHAKDAAVLSVFAPNAGLSAAAAAGGAAALRVLESDAPLNIQARQAWDARRDQPAQGQPGDVFAGLADLGKAGQAYDVVLLRPPLACKASFGRFEVGKHSSRLFEALAKVARPGAALMWAAPSAWEGGAWTELAVAAARSAGRTLEVQALLSPGWDLPETPVFPEGRALPCVVGRLN